MIFFFEGRKVRRVSAPRRICPCYLTLLSRNNLGSQTEYVRLPTKYAHMILQNAIWVSIAQVLHLKVVWANSSASFRKFL